MIQKIERVNKNFIKQIWAGTRKLPNSLGGGQQIAQTVKFKAKTDTSGRKKTESEIIENDRRIKEWSYDKNKIVQRALMGEAKPQNAKIFLSHLDKQRNQKT